MLLSLVAISFHVFFTGMSIASLRGKIFTKEWLQKHFGDKHREATGTTDGLSSYPDVKFLF